MVTMEGGNPLDTFIPLGGTLAGLLLPVALTGGHIALDVGVTGAEIGAKGLYTLATQQYVKKDTIPSELGGSKMATSTYYKNGVAYTVNTPTSVVGIASTISKAIAGMAKSVTSAKTVTVPTITGGVTVSQPSGMSAPAGYVAGQSVGTTLSQYAGMSPSSVAQVSRARGFSRYSRLRRRLKHAFYKRAGRQITTGQLRRAVRSINAGRVQ